MPTLCSEVSVSQKFRNGNLGSSASGSFLGLRIRHWLGLRWLTWWGLQDPFLRWHTHEAVGRRPQMLSRSWVSLSGLSVALTVCCPFLYGNWPPLSNWFNRARGSHSVFDSPASVFLCLDICCTIFLNCDSKRRSLSTDEEVGPRSHEEDRRLCGPILKLPKNQNQQVIVTVTIHVSC